MGFVYDEQESFIGIFGKPVAGVVENRSLKRPHQHVLEHGIVSDKNVWRSGMHFMTCYEFRIPWSHHAALEVAILIVPSSLAVPGNQIGLRWPFTPFLQLAD